MSEAIGKETRVKLERLCESISVSRNLDDEIRMELMSHMEDKLSAYLDGSETITEEDAFILVREHFGNPANITNLYNEVEDTGMNGQLARKLGALMVVSSIVCFMFDLLSIPFRHAQPDTFYWLHIIFTLGPPVLFLSVLVIWSKEMEKGHTPWFLTVRIRTFSFILAGAILAQFLLVYLATNTASDGAHLYEGLLYLPYYTTIIFGGVAWLWWCDIKNLSLARGLVIIAAWTGYILLYYCLTSVVLFYNRQVLLPANIVVTYSFYHMTKGIVKLIGRFIIYPLLYLAIVKTVRKVRPAVQVAVK